MNNIKVLIQSLDDEQSIREAMGGMSENQFEQTDQLAVAIQEGGTKSGQTSLMFLLTMPDGTVKYAQMTANNFTMLTQAFHGAEQRFKMLKRQRDQKARDN